MESRGRPSVRSSQLSLTLVAVRLWDVADVVHLQRIHGDLLRAVVDEVKLSALVQRTSQLSFPLCGIGFVHSLVEFARFYGPGLQGAMTINTPAYTTEFTGRDVISVHLLP